MSASRPPQCAPPPPPPYNPNRSRYNSTGEYRQRTSRSQTPGPTPSRPIALPPLRMVNLSSPLQDPLPSLSMIAGETAQRYRHRSLQRSSRVPEYQDRLTPPLSSPSPSPSSSSSPPSSPPSSSSSYSGTVTATPSHAHLSSHLTGPPSDPLPPAPPNSQILKNRSKFHPLAVLKLSKSARHPTSPQAVDLVPQQAFDQIRPQTVEETARYSAQQREIEEAARRESAQAGAKDNVRSLVECLLSGRLPPDEERSSIFSACAQACELGGLDLSTVLQELAIEGYPPIYWAIVNRAAASGNNNVELDSLVFALLDACRPLSPATLDAIRHACMTASDNVLLQRLFRDIPPLSPLSARDMLLLGPANLEDHVDVNEKRDGTGSFVAHIQIPRFRLRMRVCKSVAVEFVASCRLWILRFNAVVETATTKGQPESKWYLSLELGPHSQPTTVNASLLITGSSNPEENRDPDPARTVSFGCNTPELSPGRMLRVRLDDCPIGPHLQYESSMLVDSKDTFYAELSQSTLPPVLPDTMSISTSTTLQLMTPTSEVVFPPLPLGPPTPPTPKKKRNQEVHVTLRRGGR